MIHAFKTFEKNSVTFGTAVTGAGNVIIGIGCYLGSLPNLFTMANTKFGGIAEVEDYYFLYPLIWTILSLGGFVFQEKRFNRYYDDSTFKNYYN